MSPTAKRWSFFSLFNSASALSSIKAMVTSWGVELMISSLFNAMSFLITGVPAEEKKNGEIRDGRRCADRRLVACQNGEKEAGLAAGQERKGSWPFLLLLLMPVFPKTFFTLVRSHFVSFSLFSAWHSQMIFSGYL